MLETFWRHAFAEEYLFPRREQGFSYRCNAANLRVEFTLTKGPPQEKLVVLRQCIEKIWINKPDGEIKLAIYQVPAGKLQDIVGIKTSM